MDTHTLDEQLAVLGLLDEIRDDLNALRRVADRATRDESVAVGNVVAAPAAGAELVNVQPPGPGLYLVRVLAANSGGGAGDNGNVNLLIGKRVMCRLAGFNVAANHWYEFHYRLRTDPVRAEAIAIGAGVYTIVVVLTPVAGIH